MNSKKIFRITCTLALGLLCLSVSATQHTINSGSLQSAINSAQAHDTIWVNKAKYAEELTVDKPLSIFGIGYPTLSGENKFQVVTIDADSVHFRGFEIVDVPTSYIKDLSIQRL